MEPHERSIFSQLSLSGNGRGTNVPTARAGSAGLSGAAPCLLPGVCPREKDVPPQGHTCVLQQQFKLQHSQRGSGSFRTGFPAALLLRPRFNHGSHNCLLSKACPTRCCSSRVWLRWAHLHSHTQGGFQASLSLLHSQCDGEGPWHTTPHPRVTKYCLDHLNTNTEHGSWTCSSPTGSHFQDGHGMPSSDQSHSSRPAG